MSLLELYCHVDDFWKQFSPYWQAHALERQGSRHVRTPSLSISEIMTIVIYFHQSHYRNFKAYYWTSSEYCHVSASWIFACD